MSRQQTSQQQLSSQAHRNSDSLESSRTIPRGEMDAAEADALDVAISLHRLPGQLELTTVALAHTTTGVQHQGPGVSLAHDPLATADPGDAGSRLWQACTGYAGPLA